MASAPPAQAAEPAPAPARFGSLDLDGLAPVDIGRVARSPRPIIDYVLPGMVAGTISVMVGPGGVSKSMLALQTAAIIATGADHWFLWSEGEPVTPGKVAVFNVEDPAVILDTRVHDIAASMSCRDDFVDAWHQNVTIWPLVGRGFAFGRKVPKTGAILATDWIDWISDKVVGHRLAIVDTFIRGLDGLDENSSTDVAPILALLEVVSRRTGCGFLILHHVNKSSAAPGQAQAQQAARGSSAITDNARWQSNLSTMSEAEAQSRGLNQDRKRWVQVELSKCNYGPPLESRWLYRGDGGVLDGTIKPAPAQQQAKQPKQAATVNGKSNAYAAASGSRYPDPRRQPRGPDAIDMQVPGDL